MNTASGEDLSLFKAAGITREEFQAFIEGRTLLRRLPTLAEVVNVTAFMASDQASAMTGTVANLTCGSLVDERDAAG